MSSEDTNYVVTCSHGNVEIKISANYIVNSQGNEIFRGFYVENIGGESLKISYSTTKTIERRHAKTVNVVSRGVDDDVIYLHPGGHVSSGDTFSTFKVDSIPPREISLTRDDIIHYRGVALGRAECNFIDFACHGVHRRDIMKTTKDTEFYSYGYHKKIRCLFLATFIDSDNNITYAAMAITLNGNICIYNNIPKIFSTFTYCKTHTFKEIKKQITSQMNESIPMKDIKINIENLDAVNYHVEEPSND